MDAIRVLVVEDSLTVRRHIVDVIDSAAGFEVAGEAGDGKTAIELCERLRPHVVTMDMMLPVLSGVSATEYIMAYCPTPILIVSASTNRGELFKTYDALAAGALDVLEKPIGGEPDAAWGVQLLSAIRMASRIRVMTHIRMKLGSRDRVSRPADPSLPLASGGGFNVIAIGASTGGPGAVQTIIRSLPANFAVPVLVVIHIADPFGNALAEWLDTQTALPVRYPKDGEPLPAPGRGCVFLAPPARHLEVVKGRLRLTGSAERNSCRPSVDVLFESLAREMGAGTLACLLTGMGRDGARGLLAVRESGGITVAQDEASSVVFGMPGAAVQLDAAAHVLGLAQIGPFITRSIGAASTGGVRK